MDKTQQGRFPHKPPCQNIYNALSHFYPDDSCLTMNFEPGNKCKRINKEVSGRRKEDGVNQTLSRVPFKN